MSDDDLQKARADLEAAQRQVVQWKETASRRLKERDHAVARAQALVDAAAAVVAGAEGAVEALKGVLYEQP